MLLSAALIVGCGQAEQQGVTDSDQVNIGVNYELSGAVATYGTATKNGIELAFEEINNNGGVLGGKKINPIIRDNGSKNEEAMSVASKLVAEDNVVALLGPATSGATLSAVPVATDNKIPLLTTSATNPDVTVDPNTKKVRDYIFRICFIDPPQAIVGATFAYDKLGARKAGILYDNSNDYSKGLYQVFKDEFAKKGGEIVAEESFNQGDQDFRPALTAFKRANCDVRK
ncbi:MAG: branched-chain amino acid transport system substrate-binding protein [Clostridia bacterium]|nr:branched-chain amino acid transport system substrate-binding protein [Clostridia bacterium]